MKDIKKIVSENLNKKYQMNESFEKISLIENEDVKFLETIELFGRLIDEGYNEDQLKETINEQTNWLQKLFGANQSNPEDVKTQSNLMGLEKKGMWSQFKEYAVRKLLNVIGLEGPLADAAAAALVEMSLMDLISLFRSREGCTTHSGPVVTAVLEAIVTYMVSKNVREGSWAGDFLRNNLRNTFFEYIKQEGYDKKLGNFICNFVYKNVGSFTNKLSPSLVPTTPPKQT